LQSFAHIMIEIIPAVMPSSYDDLEDKLAAVAPHVKLVQIDIMDGVFVRSKSWPYLGDTASFEALLHEDAGMPFWEKLDFEVDLMVTHPETVIDDWITAGASRIIIHVESTNKIPDIVKDIRAGLHIR
jgi:ribulose-phosphate 3-epimerase